MDPHGPTASKCPGGEDTAGLPRQTGGSRMQAIRTVVDVDTAKRVFQLHWVDPATGEMVDLRLSRAKFLEHFANRAACVIGMEACSCSQHWARRLRELGHPVRLVSAKMVRAFVGGNKNDVADARSGRRFSSPASRRWRSRAKSNRRCWRCIGCGSSLVKFRTAQINCLRGLFDRVRRGDALERVSERRPAQACMERHPNTGRASMLTTTCRRAGTAARSARSACRRGTRSIWPDRCRPGQ